MAFMTSKPVRVLFGSALVALGAIASVSSANATVIVPGTADIWAWNGIASPRDQLWSPTVSISPTLAIASLTGIQSVTISSTGETGNCMYCTRPNAAGILISHEDGTFNGVPDLTAPLDSLIGAWINAGDPALSVSFEIGTGGTFFVPTGATELFLGSMDGYQWNNNVGQFVVDITTNWSIPEPITLSLFGAGFGATLAMRRRKTARLT
jgi:hypothetical protein